jgi:HPt (histidine-containing phosphotransfer) domain-containing protein
MTKTRSTLLVKVKRWFHWGKSETISDDEPDQFIHTEKTQIPSSPGFDAEAGLMRMNGKYELYMKLLRSFITNHRDTPALLFEELEMNKQEEAILRVHSVRGVAGMLGGTDLEVAAAELERVCRKSESCVHISLNATLRQFIDCHAALIAAIDVVLYQRATVTQTNQDCCLPWDSSELHPLLARLKSALVREEPIPCKEILVVMLQRPFPDGEDVIVGELNRLVQSYRLAEALCLLDKEFHEILNNKEKFKS